MLSPAGSSSQGIFDKEKHRVADAMVTQTGLRLPPGVKDVFAHKPRDPEIVQLQAFKRAYTGVNEWHLMRAGMLELPKRAD